MALRDLTEYVSMVPVAAQSPIANLWSSYDDEADVLYIHFREPNVATDSELTDDDVIIRYDGDEVIGVTILHASQR